ncbi:MAG: hypothetical protein OXB89_00770 [Anaerolineaceae bacterium]|nr:hypothetical protein [Anaerolineaceae bacterium]
MERVGDMTREELKALVSEVIEEKLEHAIGENGVAHNFLDAGLKGPDRSERLQSIRRSSQKFSRPHNSWTNPVIEERESIRNWKPARELKSHEWITEERKARGSGSQE